MNRLAFFSFILFIFLNIFSSEVNLNGWTLVQDSSAITYTFGDLLVPEGNYLIICRGNKSQSEFESFWGVTLGTNVIFLDSVSPVIPQNNGRETYSLYDSFGVLQDTTMPRESNSDKCMQRDSSNVFSFALLPSSSASPGSFSGGGHGAGMVITEFVDTAGTGNYLYNFIEIYNDTALASGVIGNEKNKIEDCKLSVYTVNSSIRLFAESSLNGECDVSIYDLSGRRLHSERICFINSQAVIKNVSLRNGIYFIDCIISKIHLRTKLLML